MKKWIGILLCLWMSMTVIYAQGDYSVLREGELLLDEVRYSDTQLELFTQYQGFYYRIRAEYSDGDWTLLWRKFVTPPKGGLKESTPDETESIEEALRERLRARGIDPDALPRRLDHSELGKFPPIGEQYEDSCVGWAAGYYLRTFQQASDIGWEVGEDPNRIFSPSFIYNQINEGVDEGSTLQDAARLLQTVGAATLADFPYVPKDYLSQPTEEVIRKAYPHRIRDWRILYTKNDSQEYILRKTKEYLNTGDLPIVGISIGFKWKHPMIREDGVSIVTTEQYTSGGHAVVVVGYDDDLETPEGKGAFKIINSYGSKWGQDGYTYMTYPAFAHAIRAGFVYTDLVNGPTVGEMGSVVFSQPDEHRVVFDWEDVAHAQGYRIFDEHRRLIAESSESEYSEQITLPVTLKRYFQAINDVSESNEVELQAELDLEKTEELPLWIAEDVIFRMQLQGMGRYDIRLTDATGRVLREQVRFAPLSGWHSYVWDGKDSNGDRMPNGRYLFEIIPYQSGLPKDAIKIPFDRRSKIVNASVRKYIRLGILEKVEMSIQAAESGKLTVRSGERVLFDKMISAGETILHGFEARDLDKGLTIHME